MDDQCQNEQHNGRDHYKAANLTPEQLEQITSLEQNLRSTTHKDIVLIAYEEDATK